MNLITVLKDAADARNYVLRVQLSILEIQEIPADVAVAAVIVNSAIISGSRDKQII